MEIPKNYTPETSEDPIFQNWVERRAFEADANGEGESYSIVIPPPNVTGVLHMGHALNNTIQDILIRKAKLDGKKALWVVGTDHAGIATQNVVEKKLAREGKTRHELGREPFLDEVWQWKDDHGGTIIHQLKRMGCSCDYSNERFTMDEGLANAVRVCFVKLYERGLIYRGMRMIHWCTRCHTALSDEEAEHKDSGGQLTTIRYPFADGQGSIQVATTRPETLLGDTAVAVNPDDPRYKDLVGRRVVVPFVEREIPVIADNFVDPEFGTGMVKVTPAHDPNDYEMGLRHKLPLVDVMTMDGKMSEAAGPYAGQDRFECRKNIIRDLKDRDQWVDAKSHDMAIRQCYRCDSVVEPRVSKQWFVKMKPLADRALEEYKNGKPHFTPERFGNIYLRWLEGIRDWCISRQIWWGHQIPVWYCRACDAVHVKMEAPSICESCQSPDLIQETDVLDTWFSSWLWPFSTLGWPENTRELEAFYPTHTLTTAQEIIFFWVARMVMAGLEFTGKVPFAEVYIHGTVRDEAGMKMSKSYGNVIDPLKIIDQYGADALRFSLMVVASRGNDIYLSDKKFEIGRNFATKIWNASRFLLMNMGSSDIGRESYLRFGDSMLPDDQLILAKTDSMVATVDQTLREFRFNDAALALYDFFRHNFCDRYIEFVKPLLQEEGPDKERSLAVLYHVLHQFLVCLHPMMPFITEALWATLRELDSNLEPSISESRYPAVRPQTTLPDALLWTEEKYEFIKAARHLRQQFNIAPKQKVNFILKIDSVKMEFFKEQRESISRLVRAAQLDVDSAYEPKGAMPSVITDFGVLYLQLDQNLMDVKGEKTRLQKKISDLQNVLQRAEKKLGNPKFLSNAKPEVVSREKEKCQVTQEDLNKVEEALKCIESL